MAAEWFKETNTVIRDIRRKQRRIHLIFLFVITVFLIVSFRYLYPPAAAYLQFIPDISVTLIIVIVLLLSLIGLYLSFVLSLQIFRIINDYSQKLQRILDIARDLTEEVYGDILLEKIMDFGLSITGAEAGSILLADDNSNLEFKIVKGGKEAELVGTVVERGKGVAGWVLQGGVPVRIPDASKDERFNPEIDDITGFTTKSILCAPLRTGSQVVGVIELINKIREKEFSSMDEEFIMYLANHAAISIIKTKFYEDQRNYEIHLTEMLLDAIDFQMPEKKGHSRRVARYSNVIARVLNMTEEEKKRLYFACLLHDIGFLKIRYDESYHREVFERHPVLGHEMIRPVNFYSEIAPFILYHHERYDGYGYPEKLKGEDIPLEARIIAIAEAFDAMVSPNTYRVPVGFDEAVEELKRNAGTQFDPELVAIFLNNITVELVQKA